MFETVFWGAGPEPWWPPVAGAWMGALGGSTIGLLSGLLGGTIGFLAHRGRGETWVMAIHRTATVIGVLLAIGGLIGLASGQPFYVWYVLLLPGVVMAGVWGPIGFVLKKAYRQHAERRLAAEELRRA